MNIQALENCEILLLSKDDLQGLYKKKLTGSNSGG